MDFSSEAIKVISNTYLRNSLSVERQKKTHHVELYVQWNYPLTLKET